MRVASHANTRAARRVPRTVCVFVDSQHGVKVFAAARGRHEARSAPAGSAPRASAPRSAQPLQCRARCAQLRSRDRRAPAACAHRRGVRRAAACSWRTARRSRRRGRSQRPRRLHGAPQRSWQARNAAAESGVLSRSVPATIRHATRVPFPARTRVAAPRVAAAWALQERPRGGSRSSSPFITWHAVAAAACSALRASHAAAALRVDHRACLCVPVRRRPRVHAALPAARPCAAAAGGATWAA